MARVTVAVGCIYTALDSSNSWCVHGGSVASQRVFFFDFLKKRKKKENPIRQHLVNKKENKKKKLKEIVIQVKEGRICLKYLIFSSFIIFISIIILFYFILLNFLLIIIFFGFNFVTNLEPASLSSPSKWKAVSRTCVSHNHV